MRIKGMTDWTETKFKSIEEAGEHFGAKPVTWVSGSVSRHIIVLVGDSFMEYAGKGLYCQGRRIEPLKTQDILESFDSHVHELELGLEIDGHAYDRYIKNPAPYWADLLLDYGNWAGIPQEQREAMALLIAEREA